MINARFVVSSRLHFCHAVGQSWLRKRVYLICQGHCRIFLRLNEPAGENCRLSDPLSSINEAVESSAIYHSILSAQLQFLP